MRLAVIGYGSWGAAVARVIAGVQEGTELAAICDVDRSRLAAAQLVHPSVPTFPDHAALLEGVAVDAVWVATPLSAHAPVAMDCITSGKHTLIEKPIAGSSAEALSLLGAAREADVVLMAGHLFIYDAAVGQIRSLIADGAVGAIHYVESHRTGWGRLREDADVIWDLAVHDLYLLRHLLGSEPLSVRADGFSFLRPPKLEVAALILRFPRATGALVNVSWLGMPRQRELTIAGSLGVMHHRSSGGAQTIELFRSPSGELVPGRTSPPEDPVETYSYPVTGQSSLLAECSHFVTAIRSSVQPLTNGYDGLRVVDMLEASSTSLAGDGIESPVVRRSPDE